MRSAILATLVGVAAAQNATQIAGLLQVLTSANLTSLAAAAQAIGNTTVGQGLLAALFNGPVTVLAPNNNAFTGVPKNISSNPELLANVLAYHVIPGTVNQGNFFNNSDTVVKTLLNSSSEVFLGPGDQKQAIAFRLEKDNFTHVLNQNTPVRILNTTVAGNVTLNIVDGVVDLPGDLGDALKANKLSLFTSAAAQAGLLTALNTTHGVTIFAPTDAAFSAALANMTSTPNATTLAEILANHVVNGSVIYSTELTGNPVSAGGESFSFATNADNSTVTSGNSTATITTADIILWNGVVHIIDAVLLNNQSNPGAASSAFESATSSAASAASVAATATTPPGVIGTPAPSGTNGNGSTGGSGGKGGGALSGADVSKALMLVGISAVAGIFAL